MLLNYLKKPIYAFSSIRDRINQERAERLKNLPTTTQEKIRNFWIISHIDAGKTTTIKRMLFYAGAIPFPGEVHDGTTTMDFMPQERKRGITIRSAAKLFNWANHQYNLIDTAGHIDFTAEVERSLRVLDEARAIFDGVSGVKHSQKQYGYKLINLIFLKLHLLIKWIDKEHNQNTHYNQ